MIKNKGWFKKGKDDRRTGFQKGHPSYVTLKMIADSRERMKKNNPMHNKKIKKIYMIAMKKKVWNNPERNRKVSELMKGRTLSEETRNKISNSNIGRKNSESSKQKNKIKQIELMKNPINREKRRVARQKQILVNGGGPTLGVNEKRILDELELSLNYKIIRQYTTIGYWVDGYIPELNLVVEVDERIKNNLNDVRREKEIKKQLNCSFVRVGDYKYGTK